MSTYADLLEETLQPDTSAATVTEHETRITPPPWPWNPEGFAEEQIRGLVRQVFFPGPKPVRQVVFCAVDNGDITGFCMQVGVALALQSPGSVCLVEANPRASELDHSIQGHQRVSCQGGFGRLRNSAQQISSKLWVVPINIFQSPNEDSLSADWLRVTLRELRLDFDYTVLHGPPAGLYSETALLGHLSDGVVLVLEANSTRRVAAQTVVQKLRTANARLFGTVLNQRTFPIPERIYRKL